MFTEKEMRISERVHLFVGGTVGFGIGILLCLGIGYFYT